MSEITTEPGEGFSLTVVQSVSACKNTCTQSAANMDAVVGQSSLHYKKSCKAKFISLLLRNRQLLGVIITGKCSRSKAFSRACFIVDL